MDGKLWLRTLSSPFMSMLVSITHFSPLEVRRFSVENVAGLHSFGQHPNGSIEHALDVACYLNVTSPKDANK